MQNHATVHPIEGHAEEHRMSSDHKRKADPRLAQTLKRLMNSGRGPKSQNALSKATGVGQSTISRLLLGEAIPTAATLARIAEAYGEGAEVFFKSPDAPAERDRIGNYPQNQLHHPVAGTGAAAVAGPAGVERVDLHTSQPYDAPVQFSLRVDATGHCEIRASVGEQVVPCNSPYPGCYAVRILGDQLHPLAKAGSLLLLAPEAPIAPEDDVLVKLRSGELMLVELLADRGDDLTFLRIKTGERLSVPKNDIEFAHPIVAKLSRGHFLAEA